MKVAILVFFGVGVVLSEPPVPTNRYLPSVSSPSSHYVSSIKPSFDDEAVETDNAYFPEHGVSSKNPLSSITRALITPNAQYGVPSTKYGTPSSRNYLSPVTTFQQGAYGTPTFAPNTNNNLQNANFAQQPATKYNAPLTHLPTYNNQPSIKSFQQSTPSRTYGTPSFAPNTNNHFLQNANFAQQPATKYNAPSIKSYQQSTPSRTYGTPSFANDVMIAPYNYLSKSSPVSSQSNTKYGAPRSYLPPSGLNHQEEPANYDFKYDVQDHETNFGHEEERHGDDTQGKFYVQLPDGKRQIVEYTADQDGFKPKISYEETGNGRSAYYGGYKNGVENGGYQY